MAKKTNTEGKKNTIQNCQSGISSISHLVARSRSCCSARRATQSSARCAQTAATRRPAARVNTQSYRSVQRSSACPKYCFTKPTSASLRYLNRFLCVCVVNNRFFMEESDYQLFNTSLYFFLCSQVMQNNIQFL